MEHFDIAIIGGGPAGLTAALYAARANKTVVVIEKLTAGGQLAVTPVIENYPGAAAFDGWALAEKMREQAENVGAEILYADAETVYLDEKKIVTTGGEITATAVIIATGARSGKLGIAREDELKGSGVSYCAVCDGAFFRGKDVALVGGSERSLADLKYLSGVCRKVYYITGGNNIPETTPSNVETLPRTSVKSLSGMPLESIVVSTPQGEKTLKVEGLFVDTALKPQTDALVGALDTDASGFIITDAEMRTSIKKVYAAGDVRHKSLRQVVTAASDGAIAAATAIKELKK